jgi:RNA-directed DNA polymerase
MVETEATAVVTPTIEDWTQTPWQKLERHVYRLQKRIYRAQSRGNDKAVHSLQRLLMKSQAARTVAVRRVTQDNRGKKTAGVDGIKSVGPMVRLLMVERLRHQSAIRAQPVRRVFIPKAGKRGEYRPLGIPVLLDRAHQTLAKLALEPAWEARFGPNSYGFRPGRSCQDAIVAIYMTISTTDKYVLDADIKGCFDGISHQALLNKLDATPVIRRAVKAWLQAGVMHDGVFTPTVQGSPQGGCISPLLANVALHGLEEVVERSYRHGRHGFHTIRPKLIIYADDFVIICRELAGVEAAQRAAEQFLAGMGLRLHPTKTRITHTLRLHEGNVGFDFLGFHVRQYPTGQTHTLLGQNGLRLEFKTLIKPSQAAIKEHREELARVIRQLRGAPQEALIVKLNPIIRGWAQYYRSQVATRAFAQCDNALFSQLRRWGLRRHPRWHANRVKARYWNTEPGTRTDFVVKHNGEITHQLLAHRESHIRRHTKVSGRASPYDGNLLYWAKRLKNHPLTGTTMGRLLALQKGKCPRCGLTFLSEDLLETDHLIPTSLGGTNSFNNKQVLHRHCHDQKSAEQTADGHA